MSKISQQKLSTEVIYFSGSAVATAVSDLKPTKPNLSGTGGEGRCSPVSKWFRSEIFKVILVYWFFCAGLALIIAALSLPEWFILRQTNVIGHIGFFRRCVYSRRRNNPRPNCYYEIISGMICCFLSRKLGFRRTISCFCLFMVWA